MEYFPGGTSFDAQIAAATGQVKVFGPQTSIVQKLVLDASKANSLQERPAFFE